jgi:hypothetical protein
MAFIFGRELLHLLHRRVTLGRQREESQADEERHDEDRQTPVVNEPVGLLEQPEERARHDPVPAEVHAPFEAQPVALHDRDVFGSEEGRAPDGTLARETHRQIHRGLVSRRRRHGKGQDPRGRRGVGHQDLEEVVVLDAGESLRRESSTDSPAMAFSGRTSFNPSVVDRTAEAGMM